MKTQVIISWGVSSFYGWGVYGLNLALQWASDPDVDLVCTDPLVEDHLRVDPLRRLALGGLVRRSQKLSEQLQAYKGGEVQAQSPLLVATTHGFKMRDVGMKLSGSPNIGVIFFEHTHITDPDALARAAEFPVIVTGSTWNTELLQAHGLTNARKIIQGIDPTLFHPAPRLGALKDRFVVFSGGKLERRKGQDIVVRAFSRFVERHPEALLVTAWNSPFPKLAATVDQSGLAAPMSFKAGGEELDLLAWTQANGIPAHAVMHLGPAANALMPPILREADLAVFPNRAEGGTNLVAMEAMACATPVVLSANTGHLDLIEADNAYVLSQQGELPGEHEGAVNGVPGWGESDPDELLEQMERAYQHREDARARGARGAQTVARFTWAETARQLKALVQEFKA